MKGLLCFTALVMAPLAFADSQTFQYNNARSYQAMQEIDNAIRVIGGIRYVLPDPASATVAVEGTAEQLSLASWMFRQMDRTPDQIQRGSVAAYPTAGEPVRVYFLQQSYSTQAFVDLVNTVRNITEVPRVFPDEYLSAIVIRANASQMATATFLIEQLDQPTPARTAGQNEFRSVDGAGADRVIRIFRLTHIDSREAIMELADILRKEAQLVSVCPNSAEQLIVARGPADRIARAAELVAQNDVAH